MPTVVGSRMRVEGNREIAAVLNKLPERLQNKVMTAVVRSGARVIQQAALANARPLLGGFNRYGRTPDQAVITRKDDKSKPQNPRMIVANHSDYFYLHILEVGAPPHKIVPRSKRGGKAGRNARQRGDASVLNIEGVGVRPAASHPGLSPRPWMRPAWDLNKDKAFDRMAKNLGRGLQREAEKLAARLGYTGRRRRRR